MPLDRPALHRPGVERTAVRVCSVPAGHPYVEAVERGAGTWLLPDPSQPWWPPAALEPAWLRANRHRFDVVHVHFGFESCTPAQLRTWCRLLERLGCPLVVTVHDLRNPHLADNGPHLERLGVLVRAAAALFTLTDGAAAEVRRRWGRRALVVPHPHLVPLQRPVIGSAGRSRTVGVHLKHVRRNCLPPVQLVGALHDATGAAGGDLEVRIDDHAPADTIEALTVSGRRRGFAVLRSARLADDDLWSWLEHLHTAVLPYRFGTHSGWLEACRDTGTRVVAPSCGRYAEQWPAVHTFDVVGGELDAASLGRAVGRSLAAEPVAPPDRAERRRQQEAVHRVHVETYRAVCRRAAAPLSAP